MWNGPNGDTVTMKPQTTVSIKIHIYIVSGIIDIMYVCILFNKKLFPECFDKQKPNGNYVAFNMFKQMCLNLCSSLSTLHI